MDLPFSNKLLNIKKLPDGSITCGCPVCINEGHDSKKEHLRIWKTLAFNCCKYSNDKSHNIQIRNILYDEVNKGDIDNWQESMSYQEDRIDIPKVYNDNLLNKLFRQYGYWNDRGISDNTLELVQGGVATIDEKSKLSGRYVIPCRDRNNKIIGFGGRLIIDNSFAPRWKLIGSKKNFIFPSMPISSLGINKEKAVILVEGMGCALKLADLGLNNSLCLFGIKVSSAIISLLISLNVSKIVVSTNNESSGIGNRAALEIKDIFQNYFDESKIVIHLPKKKDFLDMNKQEIDEWMTEYKQLIKNNNESK